MQKLCRPKPNFLRVIWGFYKDYIRLYRGYVGLYRDAIRIYRYNERENGNYEVWGLMREFVVVSPNKETPIKTPKNNRCPFGKLPLKPKIS